LVSFLLDADVFLLIFMLVPLRWALERTILLGIVAGLARRRVLRIVKIMWKVLSLLLH
jgi:hypothetical protein